MQKDTNFLPGYIQEYKTGFWRNIFMKMQKSRLGIVGVMLVLSLGDGMGEISNTSTIKGLSFMVVEVACLSLTFSELSKKNAFARSTDYYKEEYQMAQTFEDRDHVYGLWQKAYDDASKSNTMLMAYAGLSAVVWGLNLADIVIFKPKNLDENSLYNTIRKNTTVALGADRTSLTYTLSF
jgi:hypothetical protein